MEPLFPKKDVEILRSLAWDLSKKSNALRKSFHPITGNGVSELVKLMNSYYSNLIEGHNTNPIDIEKALKEDYSSEPSKRELQVEAKAHIEVEEKMRERIKAEDIQLNGEFIKWIHKEFYELMPGEFRKVKNADTGEEENVIAGDFREKEVIVGRHYPPTFKSLPEFIRRFEQYYNGSNFKDLNKIIAIAASHHRLAWIHPFLDGNGRVIRLYTTANLIKEDIDSYGLWSISRGFARNREKYMSMLEIGDKSRQGDLDGRGNLSDEGLSEFCRFFLETAIDQVEYMTELFETDKMLERIAKYSRLKTVEGKFKTEAEYILKEVFLSGSMKRGEASRITGKSDSNARIILADLINRGLLVSDTPKGPVRLNFPVSEAAYFFPRLFPEGYESIN